MYVVCQLNLITVNLQASRLLLFFFFLILKHTQKWEFPNFSTSMNAPFKRVIPLSLYEVQWMEMAHIHVFWDPQRYFECMLRLITLNIYQYGWKILQCATS